MQKVHGAVVDSQTRCVHYHQQEDIVAIKFRCCGKYYPCYQCHQAYENHEIQVWEKALFDTNAILCGSCGGKLTIAAYLHTDFCLHCQAPFNTGCQKHYHLYFAI